MRMTIKGADFSSVSIGKVIKDLSFSVAYSDGNDVLNAFFVNWNSGSPTATDYYSGSKGDTSFDIINNANRITTDFMEVIPGMTISWAQISNTAGIPMVVAFDENKQVLPEKSAWLDDNPFTIPAGVAYIKIQCQPISAGASLVGQMPT